MTTVQSNPNSQSQAQLVPHGWRVGVVGATGAVGAEFLKLAQERRFPTATLKLFASARSVGKSVDAFGKQWLVEALSSSSFNDLDVVFFDASDEVSKQWVPAAAEAGAWVIDNSATYRMDVEVPLLVPEINGDLMQERARLGRKKCTPKQRILSGPNCSTVQLVMALEPLRRQAGLKRVVVSTYQSASGAGNAAIREVQDQARSILDGRTPVAQTFAYPLAFSCIPQIGGAKPSLYTSEEEKIMEESRKILGLPELRISATAVRIPAWIGHSESVNVELERPLSVEQARSLLAAFPGVEVVDDLSQKKYPMPTDAAGRDAVYVGRIRQDPSVTSGLNLWVVSDNLRKGAALNGIQIGEWLWRAEQTTRA